MEENKLRKVNNIQINIIMTDIFCYYLKQFFNLNLFDHILSLLQVFPDIFSLLSKLTLSSFSKPKTNKIPLQNKTKKAK